MANQIKFKAFKKHSQFTKKVLADKIDFRRIVII